LAAGLGGILILLVAFSSCSLLPVDETAYRGFFGPEVTLSCEKTVYRYDEKIRFLAAFSRDIIELPAAALSVAAGRVVEIGKIDDSHYYIDVEATGSGLSVSILGKTVSDIFGKLNPSPSNTVGLSYEPLTETGLISRLCASDSDNFLFALDRDKDRIYKVFPLVPRVDILAQLGHEEPVDMDFSAADGKLYIAYASVGVVDEYDLTSGATRSFSFSDSQYGLQLRVDPIHRRIYILSSNQGGTIYTKGLYILNMDTGAKLAGLIELRGESIVLDAGGQRLFTAMTGESPAKLYRYSVAGDSVALEETSVHTLSARTPLALSPDASLVGLVSIYPSQKGHMVASGDFSSVHGDWDMGSGGGYAVFNPTADILYIVRTWPYDNHVCVMGLDSNTLLKTLDFPNTNYYSVFATNKSGTAAVGFSCNTYYGSEYRFYFFTDIR
jgi:hypothetical protein